uniref:Putative salivary lipocalin n=1 Tax=Rhipicephalus pulchellus TaxID=72859 RepID=L7MBW3_RHIPC
MRLISAIMGRGISPLVALICWLPYGYITVHGNPADTEIFSDTRKFLQQLDDIYLVGLTGEPGQTYPNHPYRCIKAKYGPPYDRQFRRHLRFMGNDVNDEWDNKEVYIGLSVDETRKKLDIVDMGFLLEGAPGKTPPQDNFDVVYASTECLIIGKRPYRNGRHVCTLWARKNVVASLPQGCIFPLRDNCYNAYIFPQPLRTSCSSY